MVDVGKKQVTRRTARAQARIHLPPDVARALVKKTSEDAFTVSELTTAKGPVFSTAIVAGVMAAKRTSETIPFCHPLPLDDCQVDIRVLSNDELSDADLSAKETDTAIVQVDCRVAVTHKTGVEMEALTGASSAALCIYDMCKALSHDILIKDIRLVEKTGGKRDFSREARGE